MLLGIGDWIGRGSIWTDGESLGDQIKCDVLVTEEVSGMTINAKISPASSDEITLSAHVVSNPEGTYSLEVALLSQLCSGVAKLDSFPLHGMLWNEEGGILSSFTVFSLDSGLGFRGFARANGHIRTWEIRFSQDRIKHKDNVVAFRSDGR